MSKIPVVLVDLVKLETYQPIAAALLKGRALADPELRDRVSIHLLTPSIATSPAELLRQITRLKPRLVGFSCYVWNIRKVVETAALLKAADPEVAVVLGGPEVSPSPQKVLDRQAGVDYIALGEGEETFRRLLRRLVLGEGALGDVPGLAYRDGGTIVKTAAAAQVDLSTSGSPYLSQMIEEDPRANTALMETSRGCPFTCKFCEWGPRNVRYTPLAQVEEEFRHLAGKFQHIVLCDADVLMHKKRGFDVLRLFVESTAGTDCMLFFNTNPLFLDPTISDFMARAPRKFGIFAGLQTIDAGVSEAITRPFDLDRVEKNLEYLRRVAPGVDVEIPIIYGLPGDNLDKFRGTLDWAMRKATGPVHIHHTLVLPGTDLEREAGALGLVYQEEAPHQILETPTMDRQALGQARELAFFVNTFQYFMLRTGWQPSRDASPMTLVEEWLALVRESGIDLTMGVPLREIGSEERFDQINRAYQRLFDSPVLCASLLLLSRRFAQERGQGFSEAPSNFRHDLAAA